MNLYKTLMFLVTLCIFGVYSEYARTKRQSNPADALVDAVFQIPIQTLTSVGTLVKATRPVIMQVRQRIQQTLASQPQRFSFPGRQPQRAEDRISSGPAFYQRPSALTSQNYQRPSSLTAQNFQRPSSNPTSAYNRLHQQPPHRFSGGRKKYS